MSIGVKKSDIVCKMSSPPDEEMFVPCGALSVSSSGNKGSVFGRHHYPSSVVASHQNDRNGAEFLHRCINGTRAVMGSRNVSRMAPRCRLCAVPLNKGLASTAEKKRRDNERVDPNSVGLRRPFGAVQLCMTYITLFSLISSSRSLWIPHLARRFRYLSHLYSYNFVP